MKASLEKKFKKVEIDFTDDLITASGGSYFLSQMVRQMGLKKHLCGVKVKRRQRGVSDADTLLSLIYCLAQGDGFLSDVDRLGADAVRGGMLDLEGIPDSRRAGEYLTRFDKNSLEKLNKVSRYQARCVVDDVCKAEQEFQGYIPVFIDGSGIEVGGRKFEGAGKLYTGDTGYWLHNIFIGDLWVSQKLHPGGVGVTYDWKAQMKEDVTALLQDKENVWVRVDNAYYKKSFVEYCREESWDFSISVTHGKFKEPLKEELKCLKEDAWVKLDEKSREEAAFIYHQPQGWEEVCPYVVIRRWYDDNNQKLLIPWHTFILVSRDNLPLKELVRRHRGKQGQENAQKGPLRDMDLHHPPCKKLIANQAFILWAK